MPILSHVLLEASTLLGGTGRSRCRDRPRRRRAHRRAPARSSRPAPSPSRRARSRTWSASCPAPTSTLKRLPNQHVEVKSGRTQREAHGAVGRRVSGAAAVRGRCRSSRSTRRCSPTWSTRLCTRLAQTRPATTSTACCSSRRRERQQPGRPADMVATDGHRLVRVERTFEVPRSSRSERGDPAAQGARRAQADSGPSQAATTTDLELGFKDHHAVARRGNTMLGMRLVDGQFPDYKQVIPKLADKIVRIARQDLVDCAEARERARAGTHAAGEAAARQGPARGHLHEPRRGRDLRRRAGRVRGPTASRSRSTRAT